MTESSFFDAEVICKYRSTPDSSGIIVRVYPDMLLASFLAACANALGLRELTAPPSAISIHLRYRDRFGEWQSCPNNVHGPVPESLYNQYELEYVLHTAVRVIAVGKRFDQPIQIDWPVQYTFSLFADLRPREIWSEVVRLAEQDNIHLENPLEEAIMLWIADRRTNQSRPVIAGSFQDQGIQPHEQLVMSIVRSITVQAMDRSGVAFFDPGETWGALRERLYELLVGEAFRNLSPFGAFRVGEEWMDPNAQIGQTLDSQRVIYLHPIVTCAIIAVIGGKLMPFTARIPGDLPLTSILGDLKRQMEEVGLNWPAKREMRLVSHVPMGYPADLYAGRLGMVPTQRLMDIGVQQGWAVLFLIEAIDLPSILKTEIGDRI